VTTADPRRSLPSLFLRLAAEFGIVVLGVTGALWADAWVAERNDRETETQRVVALREDVARTIELLGEAQEEADDAVTALRWLTARPRPARPDTAVVRGIETGLLWAPAFAPELSVYDDLKSSGELALLTNPDLRRALSGMESYLERVTLAQEDLVSVQQLNVDPYVLTQMDVRPLLAPYLDLPVDGEADRANLALVGSQRFQNLAIFKLDLTLQMRGHFERAVEILQAVAGIIDAQLEVP
jgi:hypothetical protein